MVKKLQNVELVGSFSHKVKKNGYEEYGPVI
jgi:hypothetical protein